MSKYTLPPLDVLIAEYMEVRSATKLAQRYHCRPWAVQQLLKEAGVLGEYRLLDPKAIVADYLAGMRLHDIAKKHGHDYNRIRAVIREAGVSEGKKRCGTHATPKYHIIAHTALPLVQPTDVQWAYIAGCVDGEGTIHNAKTLCRRRFMILVTIAQKDRSMLDWIAETSGVGQVVVKDQDMHTFWLRKQRHVYYFLQGIVEMLIVKKALALEGLQYLEERYGTAITHGVVPPKGPQKPLLLPSAIAALREEQLSLPVPGPVAKQKRP